MTLPRAGSRVLRIEEVDYRWVASGNDDYMFLYVELADAPQSALRGHFDYLNVWGPNSPTGRHHVRQGTAITPTVVRAVVSWALSAGWQPSERGPMFEVREDRIKLIAPVAMKIAEGEVVD